MMARKHTPIDVLEANDWLLDRAVNDHIFFGFARVILHRNAVLIGAFRWLAGSEKVQEHRVHFFVEAILNGQRLPRHLEAG